MRGEKTLAKLAAQFDVHANVIKTWRDQLLEGVTGVFGANKPDAPPPVDVKELNAKIGQLGWGLIKRDDFDGLSW